MFQAPRKLEKRIEKSCVKTRVGAGQRRSSGKHCFQHPIPVYQHLVLPMIGQRMYDWLR